MNELFTDLTNQPRPLQSAKLRDQTEKREISVERMPRLTPRKDRVSASPALTLPQARQIVHISCDIEHNLSQMMSPAVNPLKRQREDISTHVVKKFRGEKRTVELVNVELKRYDSERTELFRCFYECEIVPPAVSCNMIESLYDDDCPTDDETIEAATELLKRRLEDAILSNVN